MAEVRGEKDVSSFKKSAFKNFVADKSLFSNKHFFSHSYLKLSSSSRPKTHPSLNGCEIYGLQYLSIDNALAKVRQSFKPTFLPKTE